MPPIFELYDRHKEKIKNYTVIRLHGPDRKGMEQQTGKDWSQVVEPKDKDIALLTNMLKELDSRRVESFVFVNNHFEGSAPRTIARINEALAG